MKTKSLVIVAVLVVGAFVSWQLMPAGEARPIQEPQRLATAATAAAGEADQRRAGDGPAALVRTDAGPSGGSWIVRGEVWHGSVAPLPGTSFTARLFAGGSEDGAPLYETMLTSDAAGAFEWLMPVPSGMVTLSFAPCRPDTMIMTSPRTVLADEAPPQDVTVFAFVKDCEVTGKVLDDTNRPIAGAWVKAGSRDAPTRCDADGGYRLMTWATYGDTTVVAGAPGYVLAEQAVSVKGRAAKAAIHFVLKPAARLAGRVVDRDGVPVAGGLVYTYETYDAKVVTDVDGRFEIPHLDPMRERHTLQFEHADYLIARKDIASGELDAGCELVVERGARVGGNVLGPDGRAVAGAHVRLGEWTGMLVDSTGVSR
jgi:hypothetical protein